MQDRTFKLEFHVCVTDNLTGKQTMVEDILEDDCSPEYVASVEQELLRVRQASMNRTLEKLNKKT